MSDDWAYGEYGASPYFRPPRQTHLVRMQHGATALGISLEAYLAHREAGESWCSWHKAWHPVEAFRTRSERLLTVASTCREGAAEGRRQRYRRR